MGRGKRTDAGICTKCLKCWPEEAVWCPTCGPPLSVPVSSRPVPVSNRPVREIGSAMLPSNVLGFICKSHRLALEKPDTVIFARAAEAVSATMAAGQSHKVWKKRAYGYLMARLRNGDWI